MDKEKPAMADIQALIGRHSRGGPHEWGYRDPATGDFIADEWPFEAYEALTRLSARVEELEGELEAARAAYAPESCSEARAQHDDWKLNKWRRKPPSTPNGENHD